MFFWAILEVIWGLWGACLGHFWIVEFVAEKGFCAEGKVRWMQLLASIFFLWLFQGCFRAVSGQKRRSGHKVPTLGGHLPFVARVVGCH